MNYQFYRGLYLILGPTLFVLFLNEIVSTLSTGTNIMMYADDTKIWRQMECLDTTLQRDVDYLITQRNKMYFHPSKCNIRF